MTDQSPSSFIDIRSLLSTLPPDRAAAMERLHATISAALQPGFGAQLNGNILEYVVPLSVYPAGYHVTKNTPLPYFGLINQKRHLGVYAFCLYTASPLHERFKADYLAATGKPVDMGASCIRLKKMDAIPYELIADLAGHFSVDNWIATYEAARGARG